MTRYTGGLLATLCLLAALAVGSGHAMGSAQASSRFIIEQAYFTDTTAELTIEDIAIGDAIAADTPAADTPAADSRFTPLSAPFSAGYGHAIHWLRLTVAAPPADTDGKRRLLLAVAPLYLEQLTLYIPRDKGSDATPPEFDRVITGSALPMAARDYPHRELALPMDFQDAHTLTVYLRIQTRTSALARVRAWLPEEFVRQQHRSAVLKGLYVGLVMATLAGVVSRAHWWRDPWQRWFAILMALGLLMVVGSYKL